MEIKFCSKKLRDQEANIKVLDIFSFVILQYNSNRSLKARNFFMHFQCEIWSNKCEDSEDNKEDDRDIPILLLFLF